MSLCYYFLMIKVRLFSQQVRRKRVLYDNQLSSVLFNDPGWREQRWYLVSNDNLLMVIVKEFVSGLLLTYNL